MTLNLLAGVCRAISDAISTVPPSEAGRILRKGAGGDSTKTIDLVAEEAAVKYLEATGFQGTLVSEELGTRQFGHERFPVMILDPVDGTTNAVRGLNFYSISVAVSGGMRLSDCYAAMVMELPTGRKFAAELGKGATMNGARITMPDPPLLKGSLIGVDLNVLGDTEKLERIVPLILGAKHIRNMGSAALELCLVASGGLDLYADNRGLLRVTDVAAAVLVIREAGGLVLDMNGAPLDCPIDISHRISLIAGSKTICDEALALMNTKIRV